MSNKFIKKMTIEELISFLKNSNHIDIILREGGYRIMAYVGEEQKWNTPHLSITVTDYPLPKPKYFIEVEYRKEKMLTSDKKSLIDKVKSVTHNRYIEIEKQKDCKLKEEFDVILGDLVKSKK